MRLLHRVVVDVDDVVEHAHRGGDGAAILRGRARRPEASVVMCATRFTEPKLQTAISVSLVLSVISVQRLDECTTPMWFCGERTLHGS